MEVLPFTTPAVIGRGTIVVFPEHPYKIAEVVKSHRVGGFGDAHLGGAEQLGGTEDPVPVEIVDGGPSAQFLEKTAEIIRAVVQQLRQVLN
jgi:hypothetical protein